MSLPALYDYGLRVANPTTLHQIHQIFTLSIIENKLVIRRPSQFAVTGLLP
jgi:hypothetical protein